MEQGWLCPKCGRVNAPLTPYCDCYMLAHNKTTNDICKHEWVCNGASSNGFYYMCKLCGITKFEPHNTDHVTITTVTN